MPILSPGGPTRLADDKKTEWKASTPFFLLL